MNRNHYKYLIVEQGILTFIINVVINAAIGYAAYIGMATLPLWGIKSIAGDTLIMVFVLTIIVCFIVTLNTYKKIKGGRLESLIWRRSSHAILSKLPQHTFLRSLIMAILLTAIISPVVIAALSAMNVNELTHLKFVLYKGILAGFLAIIVAPLSAVCALGDA